MGKVKLTREQAEELELQKRELDTSDIVIRRIISRRNNKTFKSIGIDDLIKALYIGYEVEETFEVGDWIYSKQVEKIIQINDEGSLAGYNTFPTYYRHATPEEIAEEKQRRWWAKHGREVWELREGDCLISKHDKHSCQVKFVEAADEYGVLLVGGIKDEFYEGEHDLQIMRDKYEVFCFAEDRLDL